MKLALLLCVLAVVALSGCGGCQEASVQQTLNEAQRKLATEEISGRFRLHKGLTK